VTFSINRAVISAGTFHDGVNSNESILAYSRRCQCAAGFLGYYEQYRIDYQ